MDAEIGLAVVSVIFFVILYIGLVALMLFLMYLIIKWAINKSQVNENLLAIRQELHYLNAQLHAARQPGAGAGEGAGGANRQDG